MTMEQPKFNPHDKKYKKVADLPKEEQRNFEDVPEGGFITRDAAFDSERLQSKVERHIPTTIAVKIKNKLKGIEKLTEADIVMGSELKDYGWNGPDAQITPDEYIRKAKSEDKLSKTKEEYFKKYPTILEAAKTGDPEIFFEKITKSGPSMTLEDLKTFAEAVKKNAIEASDKNDG